MLPLVKQALLRSLRIFVRWYNVAVHHAGVAELVDAPDSKSGGAKAPCRFEPDLRYQEIPANKHSVLRTPESPRHRVRGLWQQYGSSRLRKGLFHRRRSLVPHVRQHMGVSIEGYSYARMSEHLRDYLRVHVAGEQQRGARMP
jgi:hypothetical protein